MNRTYKALITLMLLSVTGLTAQPTVGDEAVKAGFSVNAYDEQLCQSAQRFLVNATASDFAIEELTGFGNGFHTIQMDVSSDPAQVTIAQTRNTVDLNGAQRITDVACKMVSRTRINDVLELDLPEPEHQCREFNERTYARALALLPPPERERYLTQGRQLTFGDDVIIETGGQWLPINVANFLTTPNRREVLIRSPSVRVPWNSMERNFFQGTQHCKLISLSTFLNWMRNDAYAAEATLLPSTAGQCTTAQVTSAGSCVFYFAPAQSTFCIDYSGSEWTPKLAQQECGKRHASAADLKASKNNYTGKGGIFKNSRCVARDDVTKTSGTCVFNCRQPDETLWNVSGTIDTRMTRGCDLFIESPPG